MTTQERYDRLKAELEARLARAEKLPASDPLDETQFWGHASTWEQDSAVEFWFTFARTEHPQLCRALLDVLVVWGHEYHAEGGQPDMGVLFVIERALGLEVKP